MSRRGIPLEGSVEQYLVNELRSYGYRCDKGTIPGRSGFPDRWIFRPKWSPGAPSLVEVKRPGQKPRKLQLAEMADLEARGVKVEPFVSSKQEVDDLVTRLVGTHVWELSVFNRNGLPQKIRARWALYNKEKGI